MAARKVCVTYAAPTPALARVLVESMRPADAAEIEATGMDALDTVLWSIFLSPIAIAVSFNGELAAIAGLADMRSQTLLGQRSAVAWCLTTKVVDRCPVTFWRESKALLKSLRGMCDRLTNVVDARYLKALRWAQRLGFDLGETVAIGPNDTPFTVITMGGIHA